VQGDIDLPPAQKDRLLMVDDTIKAWANWQHGIAANCLPKSSPSRVLPQTTTRHITYHVLSKFFRCHQATKSFNNHIVCH
jgi:hypothetical protein